MRSIRLSAGQFAPLSGDQRRTEQLLLNLFANLVEFTARRWSGRRPRVTVADYRYRRIPEEDLERVLKPFEQVDSSFRRQHQDAGLGLSLVKAIMEMPPVWT